MKNESRVIAGIILVALGIILFVDMSGAFNFWGINIWNIMGTFWPLLLVLLGVRMFMEKNNSGGVILTVLGLVFLSTNLFDWNFFAILWPTIIIAIGLSVIFRDETPRVNHVTSSSTKQDRINESVLFWGMDKAINSKEFAGGEINVLFGGAKLDLRKATIAKEGAKLHVNCMFGGIEILVPNNCRVVTNGTGILGGWTPMMETNDIEEPVLEITGSVAFGGVEIK